MRGCPLSCSESFECLDVLVGSYDCIVMMFAFIGLDLNPPILLTKVDLFNLLIRTPSGPPL